MSYRVDIKKSAGKALDDVPYSSDTAAMSIEDNIPPSTPGGADELFMRRALELARAARAREEVPVGAVLVRDGAILAEAGNEVETRQDATAHAEMLVLAEAQALLKTWRLSGTTLYVTKEPCPMCAGALAHVRVDRIVFGVGDPKAGACGGAFQLFDLPGLNHRCEITPGVLAEDSLSLLQDFFRKRRAEQ